MQNLTEEAGLPWWLSGKESACQCWRRRLNSWSGRFPEKEMAIYSSILAWEISWTGKPGGLQSMGSQRVGHNLVTEQQQIEGATGDIFI